LSFDTSTIITAFIQSSYNADVNKLATAYSDYYKIGKGYGNFISYGVFDANSTGTQLFPAGTVTNGKVGSFDAGKIKEYVGHSWYSLPSGKNPAIETTAPSYGKAGAYTWLKAPRYNDVPYEAGSLARTRISGDYRKGVSVMDRHLARYTETKKIALSMQTWLSQLKVGLSGYTSMVPAAPAINTGVAAVLNEISEFSNVTIALDENKLPLKEEVRGATEMLGLDPLYIANEGKLCAFVPEAYAETVLNAMRKHPLGCEVVIIGKVTEELGQKVYVNTVVGGKRLVDMPSGIQLPKIC